MSSLDRLRGVVDECRLLLRPGLFAARHFQFVPDALQRELLDAGARRLILCCSRQWGKSTSAAALVAHRALTRPESLVVCVSPTLRQTGEFVLKARKFVESQIALKGGGLALRLPNGSRIVGLPGLEANVRGFSAPSLVVLDEAARIADPVYSAVRPMLAAGNGDLVLLSTPFGERGFFWREWARGGAEWTRIEVKATECARISPTFLEEERRVHGAEWFAQEYLCSFIGMENQAFRQQWLAAARMEGLRYEALVPEGWR